MDRLRSIVVLLFALAQIIVPLVLFRGDMQGELMGGGMPSTPIVPATYAFSIWGLIFLASLAYAITGLLPRYLEHPLFRRIGWLTAVTYAASTLWMVVARFGPNWLTLPIIIVGLLAAGAAFLAAAQHRMCAEDDEPVLRWLVVVPAALYAGWLSVAVFANLSEVLALYDVDWFTRNLTQWTIILLVLATLLAIEGVLLSGGSIAYAAAVGWGLLAIIVANAGTVVAWVAAGGLLAVLATVALRRVDRLRPA